MKRLALSIVFILSAVCTYTFAADCDNTLEAGKALAAEKKYIEAIIKWREVPPESSCYEQAVDNIKKAQAVLDEERNKIRDEEKKKTDAEKAARGVPKGMDDNPLKPVALGAGCTFAVLGGTMNLLGFFDAQADVTARKNYDDATNDHASLWKIHDNLVFSANMKYIVGYVSYGVSAGFLLWWLFMPSYVPEKKIAVIPEIRPDGYGLNIICRY
ncbi:MAG: hypothetical protein HZC28_06025 [Spirochaetes bacterium]|nr:hypothetical protein [Spirochaetota bacterium]